MKSKTRSSTHRLRSRPLIALIDAFAGSPLLWSFAGPDQDKPVGPPAANLDEAVKTMVVAEVTLNAAPIDAHIGGLDAELQRQVAESEQQAVGAWRTLEVEVGVSARL